jgi:hypothetical protein
MPAADDAPDGFV